MLNQNIAQDIKKLWQLDYDTPNEPKRPFILYWISVSAKSRTHSSKQRLPL